MDIKQLQKPNVDEEMAKELVQRAYGLHVTHIERMASFNDQNFYIKVSKQFRNPYIEHVSDDGYTFKIINTMKSSVAGHFDSMHYAMLHLSKKGLRIPLPVRNLDGNTWKLESVPLLNEDKKSADTKECGIHLLTYLSGVPIATIDYTSDILFQWGSLLATFHNATEDLICPNLLKKSIFYSLEHIHVIGEFLENLDDRSKNLVLSVLENYSYHITKNINDLPKGFIHGDFNDQNIMVQLRSTETDKPIVMVDGILDFEDMHYGTYIWDIGLMLAHVVLDCKNLDPLEGTFHALAGYLSLRSLNLLERSLLKICIECRLSQSLVLCAYSNKLDPNNSYISTLSSLEMKRARLEQLYNINNEEFMQKGSIVEQRYLSTSK